MAGKATIQQIAELSGVSNSTVSRALSNHPRISPETKERVQAIAAQLGYRPNEIARSLKTGSSKVVGLLVADIGNPFYMEVTRGVEFAAMAAGYNVILCNARNEVEQEAKHLKLLEERRVDGILLTPVTAINSPNFCREQWEPSCPYVLLDYYSDASDISCISVDHVQGAYEVTKHLIGLQHQRIAHITGRLTLDPCNRAWQGYCRAMDEAGLSREKGLIKETSLGMADGYIAMRELLNMSKPPSAVFAFGDLLALGAYKAIEEAGLAIPGQIALAGYDDIPIAQLISLTTVAQDNFEIGRMGTEILLKQIRSQGRALHQKVILQPRLVIRASTQQKIDSNMSFQPYRPIQNP